MCELRGELLQVDAETVVASRHVGNGAGKESRCKAVMIIRINIVESGGNAHVIIVGKRTVDEADGQIGWLVVVSLNETDLKLNGLVVIEELTWCGSVNDEFDGGGRRGGEEEEKNNVKELMGGGEHMARRGCEVVNTDFFGVRVR